MGSQVTGGLKILVFVVLVFITSMATGSMQFEVVNPEVEFPLDAWSIRSWICHITEVLNVNGIEGRESVLSRSKDLAAGWAKHADTVTNYRALSRALWLVTMENNPRSGWYLSEPQLVIGGRHLT